MITSGWYGDAMAGKVQEKIGEIKKVFGK